MLSEGVAALEIQSQELAQLVEALANRSAAVEAELNEQLVVIDANDLEVGSARIDGANLVAVTIGGMGLPVGRVSIGETKVFGRNSDLYFISNDCSGVAFLKPGNDVRSILASTYAVWGGSQAFIATSASHSDSTALNYSSYSVEDGRCVNIPGTADLIPAEPILGWNFTPPFQVVTRGDLVAP